MLRRGTVPVAAACGCRYLGLADRPRGAATNVTATGATLRGSVQSLVDGDVSYWFAYSISDDYGSETPHRTVPVTEGQNKAVAESVTGLRSGVVYHYSVCARTATTEPHCSADIAFRTSGAALSVSADPALYPAFEEGIKDYVTRCTGSPVALRINAPAGTAVSVDGQPGQSGSFTKKSGHRPGDSDSTSRPPRAATPRPTTCAACPPTSRTGRTRAALSSALAFTLVTPSLSLTQAPFPYVAFFNTRGVPVWWYKGQAVRRSTRACSPATWSRSAVCTQERTYQLRRLDGTLVRHSWGRSARRRTSTS